MTSPTMTPEMQALKGRLKATWEAGDSAGWQHRNSSVRVSLVEQLDLLQFLERLALWPGMRMLDVGCGVGQIALPAAHAGVRVTGIDLADNLVRQARERANAESLGIRFEQGDA